MSAKILIFEKNKADSDNVDVTITASEGQDFADLVRNRSNRSAWVTNDSTDASETTFEVDFGDERILDSLLLVKHNFKDFTIEYWNGAIWVELEDVEDNADESTYHSFASMTTQKLRLVIHGTMVADEDKVLHQFIASETIARLNTWPKIEAPTFDKNRKVSKMLSGKQFVNEALGGFRCSLTIEVTKNAADLAVFEQLFDSSEGFLVWLCGGDTDQFAVLTKPYRMEDIFLMRCVSDYQPEFYKGVYQLGQAVDIDLAEVIV